MKLRSYGVKPLKNILPLVFAIVLSLSGCTRNIADYSGEDSTEITSDDIVIEDEDIDPVSGGELRIAMHTPSTLNPLENNDVTVDQVLKLIFEPLFNLDNNMTLQPNIAESYSISSNTLTIRVKDNIYWQDGKAIGADDVVYSLDVISDAPENSIYKDVLNNVESYSQTGDKTLNIRYKNGNSAALFSLDFPIIPKHYYRNSSSAENNPMGSGSFAFESYTRSNGLVLTGCKGLNGEPYISTIKAVNIDDNQTIINAFEGNIIDLVNLNLDELGTLRNNSSEKYYVYSDNQFEYAAFNTNREIFSTADLRRALVYLMPMDNIIKGIYINNISRSLSPINPESSYVDTTGIDNYNYNVDMANAFILASGLTKSDFSFTILVNSENSLRSEAAKILSNSFNEYGFNTSVEAVSFEEYRNRITEGDFDMYLGGIEFKENMDIWQFLSSQGSSNYTGYGNTTMNTYISAANSAANAEEYTKAINDLNSFLYSEVPVAGFGFVKNVLVTNNKVKGDIAPIYGNVYSNICNWFILDEE